MPSPFTLPSLYKVLRRSRWSAFEAGIVLDALVASGCSVATFARTHRIDARRIYPWQRRLRPATDAKSEVDSLRFVELAPADNVDTPQTPGAATTANIAVPRYQISFPTGVVVCCEGPVDRADLETILAALREAASC